MEAYLLALLGGVLIGLASIALMFFNGRIAGISGIVGGLIHRNAGDLGWRFAFVAGLIGTGAVLFLLYPAGFSNVLDRSPLAVVAAGLLVGIGTRLGSGCTSGHGVCGVSRMSPRSIVATMTFVAAGMLIVGVVSQAFGGAL